MPKKNKNVAPAPFIGPPRPPDPRRPTSDTVPSPGLQKARRTLGPTRVDMGAKPNPKQLTKLGDITPAHAKEKLGDAEYLGGRLDIAMSVFKQNIKNGTYRIDTRLVHQDGKRHITVYGHPLGGLHVKVANYFAEVWTVTEISLERD